MSDYRIESKRWHDCWAFGSLCFWVAVYAWALS